MNGIKRFKQAIKNQQEFGDGEFHLTYQDAEDLASEIEKESGWAAGIPAPVDADGEVVPLTTKVMYDAEGSAMSIRSLTCYTDGEMWRAETTSPKVVGFTDVRLLHLRRPDSWKRLEEDVKRFEDDGTACEYFCNELRICDGCRSPSHIGFNCRNSVVGDVLRRAKALAERDAKEVNND